MQQLALGWAIAGYLTQYQKNYGHYSTNHSLGYRSRVIMQRLAAYVTSQKGMSFPGLRKGPHNLVNRPGEVVRLDGADTMTRSRLYPQKFHNGSENLTKGTQRSGGPSLIWPKSLRLAPARADHARRRNRACPVATRSMANFFSLTCLLPLLRLYLKGIVKTMECPLRPSPICLSSPPPLLRVLNYIFYSG